MYKPSRRTGQTPRRGCPPGRAPTAAGAREARSHKRNARARTKHSEIDDIKWFIPFNHLLKSGFTVVGLTTAVPASISASASDSCSKYLSTTSLT